MRLHRHRLRSKSAAWDDSGGKRTTGVAGGISNRAEPSSRRRSDPRVTDTSQRHTMHNGRRVFLEGRYVHAKSREDERPGEGGVSGTGRLAAMNSRVGVELARCSEKSN